MGLSFQAARILQRLHNAIQTQGQRGLDEFRARLHELCLDQKRVATEKHFVLAAAGDGGVLTAEEAGILFRGLASGGPGDGDSISFAEILRALRSPTSRQRVALTRAVFDMIDQDRDGILSRDEVLACYRAANHPDVRRGIRASAEVRQDFLQTLSDVTTTGLLNNRGSMVSFPAFLDFYCSLTAFTSEEHFREAIAAVWVPPVAVDTERASALHTLGGAGGLVANLRAQILTNGLSGVASFRRSVRDAAVAGRGRDEGISQEMFCAAIGLAGATLAAHEMTQAFRHLDRRGVGMIHAADALRAVRGELNQRRQNAIDQGFDSLLFEACVDGDWETLDPAKVGLLFRADAHPDVVFGSRGKGEVLNEFLEAFEGGREMGTKVTRAEWREHHWDVSALIDNDDLFCGYIQNVWGSCDEGVRGTHRKSAGVNYSLHDKYTNRSSTTSPRVADWVADNHHGSMSGSSDGNMEIPPEETRAARSGFTFSADRSAPYEAWDLQSTGNLERAALLERRGSARNGRCCLPVPPGVLGLLGRAHGSLTTGGLRGAFRLLKGFRQADRMGNGKVTLSGFKAAVGGAGMGLMEAEMRIIFQHFDEDADGEVPYELFLRSIRDTLSTLRLALVHQAFDRMDSNGDGVVFVDEIADAFRAAAHPDVVEGSREEEDVRREFLESFAVTDSARSRCTREDFIKWMELVSSSIPTPTADQRFESLVRGCWGIPREAGGTSGSGGGVPGAAALGEASELGGYRRVRVVVTHADGSISVEEVNIACEGGGPSNLGEGGSGLMSREQAERARRQLAARGVHAVHVQLLTKQANVTADPGTDEPLQQLDVRNSTDGRCNPVAFPGRKYSADEVRLAKMGPLSDGRAGDGFFGHRGGEASFDLDHGLLSVLEVARKRIALRGPAGFLSLSRRLRLAGYYRSSSASGRAVNAPLTPANAVTQVNGNVTGNGPFLSLRGFKDALSEIDCGLTGKNLTHVFMRLDSGGRGELPVDVALDAIRGRLAGTRLALVRMAFSRLKGSGDPAEETAAAAAGVASQFDPRGHPEVIAGRRSPEDVRKDFMNSMSTTGGVVTQKDFESYYANISAATSADAYFSLQVQACWGLGPAAVAMVSSATSADPPAPAGENIGRSRGDYDPTLVRRTYSKAMTSAPPGVLPGTAGRDKVAANDGGRAREERRVPTAGLAAIFRKLGAEVKGLGAAWGLAGLRRALFDADRNKDGFLSLGEFKAALASLQTGLNAVEVRAVFSHLETDGAPRRAGGGGGDTDGVAPWRTLLDAIRPQLGGERLGLVRLAFSRMDRKGQGSVAPETVTQRFNASRHPSVLRGHATVEEVRKELTDTFFSAETDDGWVSEEDFIEHHANLSFGIPRDQEFRQLVMNCWGLDDGRDGASGLSVGDSHIADVLRPCRAAASQRRVLVTYADGSQSVEELEFSSERRKAGNEEASLTETEEKGLKLALLKHDNIHAKKVTLLPRKYLESDQTSGTANSSGSSAGNPVVDRRPAWAWAPMSLSEIHAAAETADTTNAAVPEQNPDDSELQNAQDREERLAKHALASADAGEDGGGGETGELRQTGAGDERREEAVWDWEDEEDGGGAGGRARQRMRAGGREREGKSGREADLSVRYLMTKIRSELNVAGMANIARRLRESTASFGQGIRCTGVQEVDFRRILREAALPLTESDIRRIFAHFENGRTGVMNADAFMNWLSGCMSDGRKVLVDKTFDRLDTDGGGQLVLDRVVDAFDATRHPEVISGRQAPDAIFKDFVEGFVAGFPPDQLDGGRVSKADFRRYFDVISATIPDDGYFELLLKTCWRMPGSDGISKFDRKHLSGGGSVDHGGCDDEGVGRDTPRMGMFEQRSGRAARGLVQYDFNKGRAIGDTELPSAALHPNEGREASFNTLQKYRAAGSRLGGYSGSGPSEENRRLRATQLSKTFDSQIYFGKTESAPEQHVVGSEYTNRWPAGGGRVGRMAEGAAWTPGGRRLIAGSKTFVSHLGHGMRVTRDEAGRRIEKPSPSGNTSTDDRGALPSEGKDKTRVTSETRSRAAAASRETPVWMPQQWTEGRTTASGGRGAEASACPGRSPFDSVSLAQLCGDAGFYARRDTVDSNKGVPSAGAPSSAQATQPAVKPTGGYIRDELLSEDCDGERSSERSLARSSDARVRGDKADFDWWGGGNMSGSEGGTRSEGTGRVDRGRGLMPRSKHVVSDTYKSSLVFG